MEAQFCQLKKMLNKIHKVITQIININYAIKRDLKN